MARMVSVVEPLFSSINESSPLQVSSRNLYEEVKSNRFRIPASLFQSMNYTPFELYRQKWIEQTEPDEKKETVLPTSMENGDISVDNTMVVEHEITERKEETVVPLSTETPSTETLSTETIMVPSIPVVDNNNTITTMVVEHEITERKEETVVPVLPPLSRVPSELMGELESSSLLDPLSTTPVASVGMPSPLSISNGQLSITINDVPYTFQLHSFS